ncbi:MAG: exosortase/archaeosortase family protein [Actinomycetota bacterium]|nr:exosortase/archaeosortase family protein [Actinomycetota bacterium]
MSIGTVGWASSAKDVRQDGQQRWQDASPATRFRVQLAVFCVTVLVAYHYSLSSLVRNLNLSTPLAYVGLVPAIALALAATRARPQRAEPAIHDRQLDYIVGLPLIASALIIELLLPNKLSAMFWVWRIDLLSLPLFVAGSIALIFGTRILWRQKLAVAYLLLAWPLPYSLVLLSVLNGFTSFTVSALGHVVSVLPVATVLPGSGGGLFQVAHAGRAFPLSVVSACSGVDGIVGFLLVGSAFAAVVTGPRLRKALWLIGGIFLLWVINVGRITFIFWAGRVWGEHVAINILHPYVGLFTFSLGVIIMILVMGRLGLRVALGAKAGPPADQVEPVFKKVPVAVPRVFGVFGVVAVTALVLGINNTGLKTFDLVANSAGEAKLASFSAHPASPTGWTASYDTAYTWAQPYFGDNSTWLRYQYFPSGGGAGNLHTNLPITADVVNTTNLESFSAYNVQACYNFHGYSIRDVAQVGLGGGIRGQALSYTTGGHGDWTIVYWIWPVKSRGTTHYERVILYLQDTANTAVSGPSGAAGITSLHGALDPSKARDRRLVDERSFMVSFARQVVQAQAQAVPPSTPSRTAPALLTAPRRGGR